MSGIVLQDVSLYQSFNARYEGRPDVFFFAHNHTSRHLEIVNRVIDILFPDGTTVRTEGDPAQPLELYNRIHRAIGWDDPEHCRAMRANPEQAEKISKKNYVPRHKRLVKVAKALGRGEVVMAGATHAVRPSKYNKNVRSVDGPCVKDLHKALSRLKLWTVIIRPDKDSQLSFH